MSASIHEIQLLLNDLHTLYKSPLPVTTQLSASPRTSRGGITSTIHAALHTHTSPWFMYMKTYITHIAHSVPNKTIKYTANTALHLPWPYLHAICTGVALLYKAKTQNDPNPCIWRCLAQNTNAITRSFISLKRWQCLMQTGMLLYQLSYTCFEI